MELEEFELDAVGCFLQYLYTGEYFPKKLSDSRSLEHDPAMSKIDNTGEQLLKHARVYVLAERLGMPVSSCRGEDVSTDCTDFHLGPSNPRAFKDPPDQLDSQRRDCLCTIRLWEHTT